MIFEGFLDDFWMIFEGFWGAFSRPTSLENVRPCEGSRGTNTTEGTKRNRTETYKNAWSRRRPLFRYLKNGFDVIFFLAKRLLQILCLYCKNTRSRRRPLFRYLENGLDDTHDRTYARRVLLAQPLG